jgi:transcription initiation factor TFIID subunit 12
MSTDGSEDRKRKPSDREPESSPASKQPKPEQDTTNITTAMTSAPPRQGSGLTTTQQQILQAVLALPSLSDEQKRKYVTGVEQLRLAVEQKGANSPEGQATQVKVNQLFTHMRQLVQRAASGGTASTAAGATAGAAPPASNTASGAAPQVNAAAAKWIPPASIAPHQADQWRADISSKLTAIGQKLSQAKQQIQEHTLALERGGHTPDQEAEVRKKLQEAHTGYGQCKEILNRFAQQQKSLQTARAQQEQQQPQQFPLATMPVQQMPGQQSAAQQSRPAQPPPSTQSVQPAQPAAMHHPQQQQQPQQPQQISQQPPAVQRVATPVDQARAGSPANVNNHVTAMNQARQQQQQQNSAMSPNQQHMQSPSQSTPQQQMPQQQGARPGVPPGMSQQPMRTSPATTAGTPIAMTAGSNSPAPSRPGSAQPQQQVRPNVAGGAMQAQSQAVPHQRMPVHQGQVQSAPRDTPQQNMPIPNALSVQQPTPVAIPPARPSLTGGANAPANQVLGTPAMIKQPAFEFDETGMSLLSKRKLEELVKQIDPDEKLDPDVEEVCSGISSRSRVC